jgi:glycerol uptake facilitator-like aquaporin
MKLVEFSFKREMGWILIFSLGPAVGAIVAALIYTAIR